MGYASKEEGIEHQVQKARQVRSRVVLVAGEIDANDAHWSFDVRADAADLLGVKLS